MNEHVLRPPPCVEVKQASDTVVHTQDDACEEKEAAMKGPFSLTKPGVRSVAWTGEPGDRGQALIDYTFFFCSLYTYSFVFFFIQNSLSNSFVSSFARHCINAARR